MFTPFSLPFQDEVCGLREVQELMGFEKELYQFKDPKQRKIEENEATESAFLDQVWNTYLTKAGGKPETVTLGNRIKTDGNELFKVKDYAAAYEYYSIAIRGFQKSSGSHILVPKEDPDSKTRELHIVPNSASISGCGLWLISLPSFSDSLGSNSSIRFI